MCRLFLIVFFFFVLGSVSAQTTAYTYTIKADSVKITNCDSAEVIIENHTQGVPGFLYNTGNGRTIFKRALTTGSDGSVIIGADTLKAWLQGGNRWGNAGFFGTLDSNNIDIYTKNLHRASISGAGTFSTDSDAVMHGMTVGIGAGNYPINTVVGHNALTKQITNGNGLGSTVVGYEAGNGSLYNLTAFGYQAGRNSQGTGLYIGAQTGINAKSNSTIAIGDVSCGNCQGSLILSIGDNNLSASGQTGWGEVIVGHVSATNLTTGFYNTMLGHNIGNNLTTGGSNTILGALSGGGLVTGNYNTILGANVSGLATDLTNAVIIADGLGNRRIYSNAVGDVGVGTTTPTSLFQVSRPVSVGTGTAGATAGTGNVVGIGTEFLNTFKVGDSITIITQLTSDSSRSETQVITAIASNTSMTTTTWSVYQSGAYKATAKNALSVKGNGNVGLSTEQPSSKMDITGENGYSQFRLRTSYTPTSSTDTNGNVGDFSWDAHYIYVKTPSGWMRSTLSTF